MSRPTHTILIDTREKLPLLFPKTIALGDRLVDLKTRRVRLSTGDYQLDSTREEGVVVERKRNLEELASNFTRDWHRFRRALDRLAECACPIILLEGSPSAYLRPTKKFPRPDLIVDKLLLALSIRRIHLWFIGACNHPTSRRLTGELLARYMLIQAGLPPFLHPMTRTP